MPKQMQTELSALIESLNQCFPHIPVCRFNTARKTHRVHDR